MGMCRDVGVCVSMLHLGVSDERVAKAYTTAFTSLILRCHLALGNAGFSQGETAHVCLP